MRPSFLLLPGIAVSCLLAGKILIHYFQLESYQFPGYFRTIRRNLLKSILPGICLDVILAILLVLFTFVFRTGYSWWVFLLEAVILIFCGAVIGRLCSEKNAKKPFVLTPRIKRLYFVGFLVMTLILFLIVITAGNPDKPSDFENHRINAAALLLFPAFLPLWIALSGLLAWPVEKLISELYFRDAQKILKSRPDLIKIGITGSWGKTSVKFILGTILEEKYHTLVTPASYNTPMGVTKVIRTNLEPGHRVFVSEMGARHVGDIREMCRLVHPTIGLITSVGPQHLDTFKTVERVAGTKYELIEALPASGLSFFADDDGLCRSLYDKTTGNRYISGLDSTRDDIWAEEIVYSQEGSSFLLCTDDTRVRCTTHLLGELNIRNILLCALVAMKLGLTDAEIVRGISKIRPVEHRLQLITNPGGITVIDDSFNSNILGAKQAFAVLRSFGGKRVVVTPGMVELGEQEYDLNREFGSAMADCCDVAILVGRKRGKAIGEGLADAGFDADNIHYVADLKEATTLIGTLVHSGDTVLFENDLPDNYSE